MTKWGLAEVRIWSPTSALAQLAQGDKGSYLIYGDGRGQQPIDAKQIEACIAWFLNEGWEPLQFYNSQAANYGVGTWCFKKKME